MQNKRYVILAVGGIIMVVIVGVSLVYRANDRVDISPEQSEEYSIPLFPEIVVENDTGESSEQISSARPDILSRLNRVATLVDADAKGGLGPDEGHGEDIFPWFEGLSSDAAQEALALTLRAQVETKKQGRPWEVEVGTYSAIVHRYLLPKLSDDQVLDIVLEDYRPGREYASKVYERMIEAVFLRTSNKSLLSLQPYIEARKDNPPWNLIEFMYSEYSVLALEAIAPIYVSDEELAPLVSGLYAIAADINFLEYSRPDKRNATIAKYLPIVKRCAEHDEWSLRAYAAAALKLKPSIRTPELLRRLGNDKVEVVRKIIRKISEEEVPKGRFD